MKLPAFELERYFARYEFTAPYLLCCSDCESFSVQELLGLEPGAEEALLQLRLGYTESLGAPQLRQQIAALYQDVSPDEILVHSGAEEAIFNFMNVLLEPGDHVIVHSPCYQSLYEAAAALGCQVTRWVGSPQRGWALDLEDLKASLKPHTRLVIINLPHNPTGYLMEREMFLELVGLSQKFGFIIFSDEVYRLLEYDPVDRLPALCEMDERGVSLGVMSKSFGLAGLRIGWIATHNRELYRQLAAFKDYTTICNSAPAEFFAILALQHRQRLLERNRRLILENLRVLNAFFARHIEYFRWRMPKAGPIAFPQLLNEDVAQYCHRLVSEAGVLLLPGTLYAPGYNHFRIGFGRRSLPQCVEHWENWIMARH
jgi:aspartate/methionine/tyrosine aminotransferase